MECKKCHSKNIEEDEARAEMICQGCGEVCEVNDIQGVTEFHEMENGKVVALGKTISTQESKQNTINKARDKIESLCSKLSLTKSLATYALSIYKAALGKGMTRGKRSSIMIGACVYLAARVNRQSLMLLDVSDKINENVYTLGKVYNHIKQKCGLKVADTDPCMFIDRFTSELEFGDKGPLVVATALKLLQRMKKDWISTGRRPCGITAAALLISARIHHFDRNYEDVARIAGISKNTAKKRLQEWSETSTANLTLSEFKTIDYEEEFDPPSFSECKLKSMAPTLEISEEEFAKIKQEIHTMNKQIEEIESKDLENIRSKKCFAQLVNSVEKGVIDTSLFMDNIDDNASDIEDELIGRNNLVKECFGRNVFQEIMGNFSKQEDELSTTTESGDLPLTMSIVEPEFVWSNQSELDLTGIDDDELRSLYLLSDREESFKKLNWWVKGNKDYYRNKKLTQQRKEEKRIKSEKAGNKPRTKRVKRDHSYLEDAKQLFQEIKDIRNSSSPPPMKAPRMSPNPSEAEYDEPCSSLKSEVKESTHGSGDEQSDSLSVMSFEVTYNYEE